jgi:DNA polymerase elongation subunit (family B)
MDIPLSMNVTKRDRLRIYYNGRSSDVELPFKPFLLCEAEHFKSLDSNTETWIKIPEYKDTEYIRASFNSIAELRKFRDVHKSLSQYIQYNNYIEQLLISMPEYALRYKNTDTLKVMFWDIEVQTIGDKRWSTPIDRPILCIGWSTWLCNPDGSMEKINKKILHDFKDDERQDECILKEFIADVKETDPDVIAGYNSEEYDTPYTYQRAKIKEIPFLIGRDNSEPWISARGDISIRGRIHYDIYKKVFKDQSLYGLKSKTLKEVARHYKVPLSKEDDIELELDNLWKLWKADKDKVVKYNDADIVRTEHVGPVYIRNDIVMAQMLQVPLDRVMNMY